MNKKKASGDEVMQNCKENSTRRRSLGGED